MPPEMTGSGQAAAKIWTRLRQNIRRKKDGTFIKIGHRWAGAHLQGLRLCNLNDGLFGDHRENMQLTVTQIVRSKA